MKKLATVSLFDVFWDCVRLDGTREPLWQLDRAYHQRDQIKQDWSRPGVYAMVDPRDRSARYIGQSMDLRTRLHQWAREFEVRARRSSPKPVHRWLTGLADTEAGWPLVRVLCCLDDGWREEIPRRGLYRVWVGGTPGQGPRRMAWRCRCKGRALCGHHQWWSDHRAELQRRETDWILHGRQMGWPLTNVHPIQKAADLVK